MKWSEGDIYEGAWLMGVQTGKGKMTWTNGDYYEGNFKDNQKNGYGKSIIQFISEPRKFNDFYSKHFSKK